MIKLGPNWVKSKNFELKKTEKDNIEYWENEFYLKLYTEIGVDKGYFELIYISNIHSWTYPDSPIAAGKLDEIKLNIKNGYDFLGDKLKFV